MSDLRKALAAEVEPWLQQCGSCDAALPMGCTCPKGDYRNILLKVWRAYEALAALPEPAPRPVVDREALLAKFLDTFDKGGLWDGLEPEAYKVRHRAKWAAAFTDAVMELARPMPTREQILSAMIAEIYEDGDTAVVRQGMPSAEWNLLSIAADAVLALIDGEAK